MAKFFFFCISVRKEASLIFAIPIEKLWRAMQ